MTPARRAVGAVFMLCCVTGAAIVGGQNAPARASQSSTHTPIEPLSESWRWARFTTTSGLPADQVYALAETSTGTPWATTRRGVAWYDGYVWHAIGPDLGLPAGRPRGIAILNDDSVIVVIGRDLHRGDASGFDPVPIVVDGLPQQILDAHPGPDGGVLIFATPASDANVTAYWYVDGEVEPVALPSPLVWSQEARHGWTTDAGSVWINTTAGLHRRAAGHWKLEIPAPPEAPLGLGDLDEDEEGRGIAFVAFPPELRGLWEWEPGSTPRRNRGQRTDMLESMDVGPGGQAAAIYRSGDIRMRHGDGWVDIDNRPPQMANALFVKHRSDGDLWVGTETALYLLRRSLSRWTYWNLPSPNMENEILEIMRSTDGSIWLATGRGVHVQRPDGSHDRIERAAGLELAEISGLAEDRRGGIWISSGSSLPGAYRWDGERWRHFGAEDGLHAPLVHRIRKDRQGRLWFLGMAPLVSGRSSTPEPGAFVFDGETFTPWGTEQGLLNGRVYDFAEAADGSRWFATAGGLSRWRSGTWAHWTVREGLRRNRVFTLAIDHEDRLWFGDQANGLGYLENDQPRYLTTSDGLIDDQVQEIEVDAVGRLWISTWGGLSALQDGTWTNFDSSTGLNNLHLWPLLAADNKIYIGTTGSGVNVLSLSGMSEPLPKVVISPPVVEEGSSLLRWRGYPYWEQFEAARVETRFRFDTEPWSAWSTDRETTRHDLAPGSHTFEVQAKGLFGDFASSAEPMTFSVPRPLFLRPDFVIPVGALIGIVVALWGVIAARKHRHAAALHERETTHRRDLEQQVTTRTEELRRSEERLRVLLETTKVIPWEADAASWNFTYVGPQAVSVLGYPVEAWYEEDFWTRHMHPDDVSPAVDYCGKQMERTSDYEFDYRMIAADGRTVWLHDIVSVVSSENKPIALRGFMIDITERKQAERERVEAEAEAHENRERIAHMARVNMLGEMATGIAHEVNQPLTAVAAYTQACKRLIDAGMMGHAELVETLGRISDEAVRAGDMIHRLKALVRKRPSELDRCRLNDLIRDVLRLAEIESRQRGVTIDAELQESDSTILVDCVQIQQVILNLLRNAIEAVGSEHGTVRIRTSENGRGTVEVTVLDTGSGVSEDDAEHLFRPFFSTKGAGMGMGLSISRSIIEVHRGEIGYRPNSPRGSVFFFTIPTESVAAR